MMGQGLYYAMGYGCLAPEQYVPQEVQDSDLEWWMIDRFDDAYNHLPNLPRLEISNEAQPFFCMFPVAYSANASIRAPADECGILDEHAIDGLLRRLPGGFYRWQEENRFAAALTGIPSYIGPFVMERPNHAIDQWNRLRAYISPSGLLLPEPQLLFINDWD